MCPCLSTDNYSPAPGVSKFLNKGNDRLGRKNTTQPQTTNMLPIICTIIDSICKSNRCTIRYMIVMPIAPISKNNAALTNMNHISLAPRQPTRNQCAFPVFNSRAKKGNTHHFSVRTSRIGSTGAHRPPLCAWAPAGADESPRDASRNGWQRLSGAHRIGPAAATLIPGIYRRETRRKPGRRGVRAGIMPEMAGARRRCRPVGNGGGIASSSGAPLLVTWPICWPPKKYQAHR